MPPRFRGGACRSYWLMVISYWAEAESPSPSAFALLRRDKHSSPEQGRGGRRREQRSAVRSQQQTLNTQHSTLNHQLAALAARKPGVFLPERLKQCVVAAKNVALGFA